MNTFDQNGSFGMSSNVSNPAGVYGIEGDSKHTPSPRFIDQRTFPAISVGAAPTTQTFPAPAPLGNFAITWGLDNKIKTPYSETFDASVQRELPGGFTLETSYVGRLGRHLLQQLDLAEPVDYVDPQGGGDYYSAGSQLSHMVDANGGNGSASVPAIQYFEDVFPFMAGVDYAGESATQAIYTNEWAPFRAQYGATTSLSDIDFYCDYGCPAGWQPHFWQDQFSSLYALSSIGMSYYNAGQITLRHPTSHGLQMDFSYTLSKSIDMGSDTERSNEFAGTTASNTGAFSEILNTWKPDLNRGPSDFDTRHLVTVDAVYLLPFGRGKMLLGQCQCAYRRNHRRLAVVRHQPMVERTAFLAFQNQGGQPIGRWRASAWSRSQSKCVATWMPMATHSSSTIRMPSTTALRPDRRFVFPIRAKPDRETTSAATATSTSTPGWTRAWKIREFGSLKFAWEVYNVTNTVRFDPASVGGQLTGGNLGVASTLLTQPRRMQFSLRYDF